MEEKRRCSWAGDTPIYVDYHDNEWGRPTHDDRIVANPGGRVGKDLKKRGFKFVGSVIVYVSVQSIGIENDYMTDSFMYWCEQVT